MKILAVEDDMMTRKILEQILKQAGHLVISSSNGINAIQAIKKTKFDVILIDIHMPKLDGLKLIQHIRENMNLSIPIAVVTRDNAKELAVKAFELGADDFILKPFYADDLNNRLQKLSSKNG